MQYIEQFVKKRQEIKPFRKCVPFLTFPKNIYSVYLIRFALQKTAHVDTRFFTDTDDLFIYILYFGLSYIAFYCLNNWTNR